ncbi:MAG: LolA family protein [Nonlabens sp.]|uniref:LolA family protein n=1 Tax=Nonlabens sp. TaxID=1888209 RepID=UPI003EF1D16B
MKNIFLIVLLSIASIGYAQDVKADKLLKEVASKFKSYDNVIFNYKGNLQNAKSQLNMDVQGEATLSGENYNVEFMGSTYIYNGSKLYVVNREDEQVTISTQTDSDEGLISPTNILTFYEKGYRAEWDIEQNVRGRKIQYIKLTPIKSNSEYKQVLLGIDINTKHIYNAIVTENSGTKATFTLLSLKTNQPLAKKCFNFDPKDYDGWDIENLD